MDSPSLKSTSSASGPSVTNGTDLLHSTSAGLSTGALAGIAIGCVLAAVVVSLLAFLWYRRKRKGQPIHKQIGMAVTKPGDEAGDLENKAELPGVSAKQGGMVVKAELITNANRHELDSVQSPLSIHGVAELEGSDVDSSREGR